MRFVHLSFAAIAFLAAPAFAASTWNWSYSGSGYTASGTFTTVDTPDMNGGYLITGITGDQNGDAITGLYAAGTAIPGNDGYPVDNLVFASGPQLSGNGFGFVTTSGVNANPFYADFTTPAGYLSFESKGSSGTDTSELPISFSATLVSTPEPATFGLLLGALALTAIIVCPSR